MTSSTLPSGSDTIALVHVAGRSSKGSMNHGAAGGPPAVDGRGDVVDPQRGVADAGDLPEAASGEAAAAGGSFGIITLSTPGPHARRRTVAIGNSRASSSSSPSAAL